MTHTFNLDDYLSILKVNCRFHQVGLPDEPIKELHPKQFAPNGSSIGASHIGSRPEILAMLKLAADKKLFPMVETLPMSAENCAEAVDRVKNNKVHYRFTLTDYDQAFGA
jgi:alcohol dehydrogenase (NADP+)